MDSKLCCVLVGLPARGKTFIARRIARYFNWLGVGCRIFNVGLYRRRMFGAAQPASFFDPDNAVAERQRHAAAAACLHDMLEWLAGGPHNQIAVYDATNSTRARRCMVREGCRLAGVATIFIESVCNDEAVVRENVRAVKMSSVDYCASEQSEDAVISDFMQRIAHYARTYEPIADGNGGSSADDETMETAVVRLIDMGRRFEVRGLASGGGLCRKARLTHLLINLQPRPLPIFLCRHGESVFNESGRIGGDGELSERGRAFAEALPSVLSGSNHIDEVWTSSFRRTKDTARYLTTVRQMEWKALDEIDAGVCEGLTYEQISSKYPKDFAARDLDKFRYRYPRGESYADLVNRLEPIVMELERRPCRILIIGHQAVLRVIIGYFMEQPHGDIPYIQVPLHTVLELEPTAYGCTLREHPVGIPCVNTHRPKPALD